MKDYEKPQIEIESMSITDETSVLVSGNINNKNIVYKEGSVNIICLNS